MRLVNDGFDATTARTFDFAGYSGTPPNLSNVTIDASAYAGPGTFSLGFGVGQVVRLSFTPVPEPLATTAILFGGAAAVVRRRRRWA